MSKYSWSYSAYSSATTCLRKFKLCYVDKIASGKPESGDLIFGSALHSALNSALTGDDAEITFTVYWDSYKEKNIEYGRYKWEQLRELGLNFISKFTRLYQSRYVLQFGETRLYGNYRGVALEGTLDFYGTYYGIPSLRDFKTSGYNYSDDKRRVALQLNLYAYLFLQNHPDKKIDMLGYTVFNKGLGSTQHLDWKFSKKDMYAHLDELVEYCNLIDSQATFPKNVNACLYPRTCEYIDVCFPKEAE